MDHPILAQEEVDEKVMKQTSDGEEPVLEAGDYWIDRPEGLPFMAWLGVNQARQLCALWGKETFLQWVREELCDGKGGNYARWWRKYRRYIEME